MGRRTEDEIQQKLVELELAMQKEQVQKATEEVKAQATAATQAAHSATDNALQHVEAALKDNPLAKRDENELSVDLYKYGGFAALGIGLFMLLSHIQVWTPWSMFAGFGGLVILPLLAGIGMLVYNYKSRTAQLVTIGSLGLIIFSIISRMTIGFYSLSLLDLILLALPICGGLALLAKANERKRQLGEQTKLIK